MENSFTSIMKNKFDSELVEIVTFNKHQYLPEAIAAAHEEIRNRNLKIDDILSKIEAGEIGRKKKGNEPFNRRYLLSAFVILFPVLILILSFFWEELFNVFLPPIVIIICLFCGLIGITLAKREHRKTSKDDLGVNHIIGVIEIVAGVLVSIVGFIGTCIIIAFCLS